MFKLRFLFIAIGVACLVLGIMGWCYQPFLETVSSQTSFTLFVVRFGLPLHGLFILWLTSNVSTKLRFEEALDAISRHRLLPILPDDAFGDSAVSCYLQKEEEYVVRVQTYEGETFIRNLPATETFIHEVKPGGTPCLLVRKGRFTEVREFYGDEENIGQCIKLINELYIPKDSINRYILRR